MKPKRNVYYDVENTLEVPFITGIQRVVREFSKIVLAENGHPTKHNYVPVVYDHQRCGWRRLDKAEQDSLLSANPRSLDLFNRAKRRISQALPKPAGLYIGQFETGSIFLDMESSWHSPLPRADLLPNLKQAGVALARLHYDIIPLLFPETTHPNTVRVFEAHLNAHLEHTSLFLCISKTTAADVEKLCTQRAVKAPTLRIVRLGTNSGPDTKNSRSDSVIRNSPGLGKYLLTVGTIEPRKNHLLLLRAFDKIRDETDLAIAIVGKKGWRADDICDTIHGHPDFGTRVHHLDKVTDPQLDRLYRNAWLSVIPSLYEGFGLPVIESLARGCPTVCSNTGSLAEVAPAYVGLFSPYSEDELTATILNLYRDKNEFRRLRNLAQDYHPDSWQQTVIDIDQCLVKLC